MSSNFYFALFKLSIAVIVATVGPKGKEFCVGAGAPRTIGGAGRFAGHVGNTVTQGFPINTPLAGTVAGIPEVHPRTPTTVTAGTPPRDAPEIAFVHVVPPTRLLFP